LKKAAKVEKGSQTPGKAVGGSVTLAQVKQICAEKMKDLNCYDEAAAVKIISGSARSMGLEVRD
jgi:large subunit ribosomal protein L11